MATDNLSESDCDSSNPRITPVAIDPKAVTTTSLEALQSADQRKLLDIVDKLRRTGLSDILKLPQLVVCGDQSSGKSSVLEAITEIPFPRKENLCTRFATEIILKRSPLSIISITITPDKLRPTPEKKTLRSFVRSIDDFNQLPNIIEEATQEMGLGVIGSVNSKAFSRDVLSVEITGPDRPQLTLVDLPGLIHATNKAQTETDKALILDLVKEYMNNPRTIILAVVSAKNDYANQIILDHCRKIDEQGRRTLGIITKPDFLREGTENELSWIKLAQNKDIYLERGWHMLKNREDNQMKFSFEQRNEDEKFFFSKGRYCDLRREDVGIDSLRERLSNLLLQHLVRELPSLMDELVTKLDTTIEDIDKLGEKRNTVKEQQMVLMKISMRISEITKSAVKGYYELPFFGTIHTDAPVDAVENIRRFRAAIQHLNITFARDTRPRGHKYSFGAGPSDDEKDVEDEEKAWEELNSLEEWVHLKPKKLSRKEAIQWVKKTLERSRGYELPGTFQPMIISQLFWEQSQPWEQLAVEHINKVARACEDFVSIVVKESAPVELTRRLVTFNVDAALAKSLKDAKEELQKVLKDKARHPSTYNHYFTTTIQKMRQKKYSSLAKTAAQASEERICVQNIGYQIKLDPLKLEYTMSNAIEKDMDIFSSQEALDIQRAYYKDELKYFVNAIVKAVIERHLVDPLPDRIFSPLVVAQMTDQEIKLVAAEPPETAQQRSRLEQKKTMLEEGLETFREAMSGLKH